MFCLESFFSIAFDMIVDMPTQKKNIISYFVLRFFQCCDHMFQTLYDLVLEVALPTCAIHQLPDYDVSRNKDVLLVLETGKAYMESVTGMIFAGSRIEELALESSWGHPTPDLDMMSLRGERLGVHVPQGGMPCEDCCLLYRPEGCPPGYTKLEVIDSTSLRQMRNINADAGCIDVSGGREWLNTHNLQSQLLTSWNHSRCLVRCPELHVTSIKGPAGQAGVGWMEYVPGLITNAPHLAMSEYLDRNRDGWPSKQELGIIQQLPMLLVLTGHVYSKCKENEARLSFSPAEMKLAWGLSRRIKRACIASKYVLKRFIADLRGPDEAGDGRSRVGSYHIKTTFLHHLEKRHPSKITSPFDLMLDLLRDLDGYLEDGKLPHYFLPECDPLETVGLEERHIARQAIQNILADPLAAVLTSPTEPRWIYGDIHPDTLVSAFRLLLTDPTCSRKQQDFIQLLACLDESRQLRYRQQLHYDNEDKSRRVSGRPPIVGLVDTMRRVNTSVCSWHFLCLVL